jgi:tetratricopeptide (TPR) repeat protein
MSRGVRFIAAGLTVTALVPLPRPAIAAVDDAKACAVETARQEQRAAIPDHLLHAISLVESGRWDADHRMRFAWPWTVTGQGDGRFLPDKRSAIDLVRQLQTKGVSNIDVGCMQVNLRAHPAAFGNLEQAFDPATNVAYAAGFLVHLHDDTGSWTTAAAYYHSQTPLLAAAYETKVIKQWSAARRDGGGQVQMAAFMPNQPSPAATAEAAPSAASTAADWFAKGRAALQARDYEAAEPAMIRAVALDRGNSLYLDALGAIAAAKGNPERAVAAYRMAIEIDKNDGFAWYNTAVIHLNAGRTDSAIEAFRRAGIAYSSKGDMENAARVLADLKSLSERETL